MKRIFLRDFAVQAVEDGRQQATETVMLKPDAFEGPVHQYVHVDDVKILVDQLKTCHRLALDAGRNVQAAKIVEALNRFARTAL
jgi:hypothetical protein